MKKDNYERVAYWCIGIGIFCFVLYGIGLFYNEYSLFGEIADGDIARTGQIGDFFGGVVGSVWTLAGVLLYFSALRMQSQEIANQMKEMNESKQLLKQQQFETTFFNLLKTQQDLKNEIKGTFWKIIRKNQSYKEHCQQYSSNDFFKVASKELEMFYLAYTRNIYSKWNEDITEQVLYQYWSEQEMAWGEYPKSNEEIEEEIEELFKNFNIDFITWRYNLKKRTIEVANKPNNQKMLCQCIYGHLYGVYGYELGHYCRHLYNIVKFVDREKEDILKEAMTRCKTDREFQIEKKIIDERFDTYIAFIHSILSSYEMVVLFYNCLLFEKAEKLFVKYKIFDNLTEELLIAKEHVELMPGVVLKTDNDIFHSIIEKLAEAEAEEAAENNVTGDGSIC